MSTTFRRLLLALLLSCAGPLQAAQLQVIASFSILADFVQQIGGERVAVESLVEPDGDAHAWQPRPSDARRLQNADLVIGNGLGFDGWLERLAASVGGKAVVIASQGVTTRHADEGHGHDHAHAHGDEALDPHAWQDVANAKVYAANIASALQQADPAGSAFYADRLARYTAELDALDGEIRRRLGAVPEARRKVVTSHDAFGYFGAAYGVRFVAAAGIGSKSEVSAATMARLIRQLKREQAPVVFIENVSDARLIQRIGAEGGARMGGRLYSDALSPTGGPAATYVAMMRHNLDTLLAGLLP